MLFRYEPKGKFTRIYIVVPLGRNALDTDQNSVWDQIKREHYHIEQGCEHLYFDDDEGEAEARSEWFESWHDPTCWTAITSDIAIDDHY
tara:strand:+ start:142 stop:408 length:267 start_codon:yes stop_codon:yes gene_type:complete